MTDFALINCYLQNSSPAIKSSSSLLCNFYIPFPANSSSKQWIQMIYDYFPYEKDFFFFRIKILGHRLGWKGDTNYYWLDFSSILNDASSFTNLVEDVHSIDLQLTVFDGIATDDGGIDFDSVIIPEGYDEYLEGLQTEESIFQREEIQFPTATSAPAPQPRYTDQPKPSSYSSSSNAAPTTSSPFGHDQADDDFHASTSSYSEYGGSSNHPKSSSSAASSAAAAINIHAMKKGVSSLWKSVKATADKLQSTVINAASGGSSLSPQAQESLHHLSELVTADFDYHNPFHLHILQELWKSSIQPLVNEEFPRSPTDTDGSYSSVHWKQAGWQNPNIVKDLKTTGLLALQSTVYFTQQHTTTALKILQENRTNIKTNYPFAIVAINLTLLLIELFSLRDQKYRESSSEYWEIFDQENHFYEIFVMAFVNLDFFWRQRKADRSQFGAMINEVKMIVISVLKRSPRSFAQFRQYAREEGFAV